MYPKHGLSTSQFYRIFYGIKARCSNPQNQAYKTYGGKGIKCLWKSFEEFKNDMYKPYLEHIKKYGDNNVSVDRIDNNGNYCKKNCRWATKELQMFNSKLRGENKYLKTIYFSIEQIKTINELTKFFGCSESTLIRNSVKIVYDLFNEEQKNNLPIIKL